MTQKYAKGVFVITATTDSRKPVMVRVTGYSKGEYVGVAIHKDPEKDYTTNFNEDDVRAELSDSPTVGTVYGVKTEHLVDVTETKYPDLPLHWYFKANSDVVDKLTIDVSKAIRNLRRKNVAGILRYCNLHVVRNPAVNVSYRATIGTYSTRGGSEDRPDVITLRFHPETQLPMIHLLAHECGHGIWYRVLSNKIRVRWIEMYASLSKEFETYDSDVIEQVCNDMISEQTIHHENQVVADAILAEVQSVYKLRARDVLFLLENNSLKVNNYMRTVLPNIVRNLIDERNTFISDYADTNCEEFFCEAFAHYCTDLNPPKYLESLLTKTIEYIQSKDAAIRL